LIGSENTKKRNRAVIIGCLAVVSVYIVVRALIYRVIPVHSLEDWFVRDNVMTMPRLTALAALFLLNTRWKICRFDMPLSDFSCTVR
jgi:hypothetical protein